MKRKKAKGRTGGRDRAEMEVEGTKYPKETFSQGETDTREANHRLWKLT